MSAERWGQGLWAGAVALVGAAVLAAVWAVWAPRDARADAGTADVARPMARSSAATRALPLSSFEAVWDLKLQEPLFASAPRNLPAASNPAAAAAPLALKLLGTIVEPGRSLAMLSTASGKPELRGVGEEIDGAQILQIEQDRVTARHNGRPVTLELQQPKTPRDR